MWLAVDVSAPRDQPQGRLGWLAVAVPGAVVAYIVAGLGGWSVPQLDEPRIRT